MTLNTYLKHRRYYEILTIALILLLVAAINATSKGIEAIRAAEDPVWLEAWAAELTAVAAVAILLPLLFRYLAWLDLSPGNLRWRALGLLPAYLVFSLAHIALFVMARGVLWNLAGHSYEPGPVGLGLLYEMRKNFLAFLVIVAAFYSYRFILGRLQGEARFLSDEDAAQPAETYPSQFLVKMLDREYLVRVSDIHWIQSAGNYVLLHCQKREYPMRQTLKSMTELLDPGLFQRVHRTAIVNLRQVASIQEKGELAVQLHSGEVLPLSRTYLPALRSALVNSALINSTPNNAQNREPQAMAET